MYVSMNPFRSIERFTQVQGAGVARWLGTRAGWGYLGLDVTMGSDATAALDVTVVLDSIVAEDATAA